MTDHTIITDMHDAVAVIRLNRPGVLNAINEAMISEVTAARIRFENDPKVRTIVLAGEGRAFCAGFDLKESAARGIVKPQDWRRVIERDFEFIMLFWSSPKPTVAAIHGYCLGGGLELAMACDLVIAAENTVLGEPEVRFGSSVVALLIPWMVGPRLAKELLLTGHTRLDTSRAASMGLINEIVPIGAQVDRAIAWAQEISGGAALSVSLTKKAINRSFDIRGMQEALLAGVDTSILIESSLGPERAEFNRAHAAGGLKAAIALQGSRTKTANLEKPDPSSQKCPTRKRKRRS